MQLAYISVNSACEYLAIEAALLSAIGVSGG